MKRVFLLLFVFVFAHSAHGSIASLFQRFTLPKIALGGINNMLLGLFYYFEIYKHQQYEQVEVQNFISNTTPWVDAPEYLKKYEPRIYSHKKFPVVNPISIALDPRRLFYIINGKLYISHRAVFDFQKGDITDESLFFDTLFEYERQKFYPTSNHEHLVPFCGGVLKVIAVKTGGSKLLYPLLRPWLRKVGVNFYWTYPKIALCSMLDLLTKLYFGITNVKTIRDKKYVESCNVVESVWQESQVRERVKEAIQSNQEKS